MLSQGQRDVLTGTLLGDGCIAKHGRHHRLHVKHKLAHEALAMLKYEAFREFISMAPHHFDQRLKGGKHPCVQFATRTHPVFTKWRSRFYVGRRKIVPADIARDLTPLALAVWLMDDGAADYAGITFQTHSFGYAGSNRLAAALQNRYGLEVSLRRNRGSWIVYVYAASVHSLRDTVSRHFLPELTYKLVPRRSRTP
jgi:LAGLIDADG DNA endonuclease family